MTGRGMLKRSGIRVESEGETFTYSPSVDFSVLIHYNILLLGSHGLDSCTALLRLDEHRKDSTIQGVLNPVK